MLKRKLSLNSPGRLQRSSLLKRLVFQPGVHLLWGLVHLGHFPSLASGEHSGWKLGASVGPRTNLVGGEEDPTVVP